MSREEFQDFIHAVEHSLSLREEINKALGDETLIIKLANKYGFKVTIKDLEEDSSAESVNAWFQASKINPIKK